MKFQLLQTKPFSSKHKQISFFQFLLPYESKQNKERRNNRKTIHRQLKSFRYYTRENEIEEELRGVSTKLRLSQDPWKIKKVLTVSDTNNLSRLMISCYLIKSQVFPFMPDYMVTKIESGLGAKVDIWDYDCKCLYQLTLKRWGNKCYVFNNCWTSTIVNGRRLKVGDEIGLFWDGVRSRFWFTVLSLGSLDDSSCLTHA